MSSFDAAQKFVLNKKIPVLLKVFHRDIFLIILTLNYTLVNLNYVNYLKYFSF